MADDLAFEYTASVTSSDLSFSAFRKYKKVNDTLAIDLKGGVLQAVYIHGNNNIVVRRGTKDVSKSYAVRRYMRVWTAPLDPGPPESRTNPYTIADPRFLVDSYEKPPGEWADAPGHPSIRTKHTETSRSLFEWVVFGETSWRTPVEGLGGLYMIQIIDLTPSLYKLAMSRAFPLTANQVESVFAPGATSFAPPDTPWKTEADMQSSDWLARHIGWESYGAYNDQLPASTP
jgi:hypothetical protein